MEQLLPGVLRNALLSGLRSSLWTLLLVWALDRDLPHLLVLHMRILLWFLALLPVGKQYACRRESECGAAPGGQLMDSGGLWRDHRFRRVGAVLTGGANHFYWNRRSHETFWSPPEGVKVVWVGEQTAAGREGRRRGVWYWHKETRVST